MTVSIQHQFNGQRLKEARMYRGMTLEELKEKIGVSKQMISKYEQNISAPTPEILFSLLQALRFPKEFFYSSNKQNFAYGNSYFRSLLSTSKKDKQYQLSRVENIVSLRSFLEETVEFPEFELPDLSDIEALEEKAGLLRNLWNLGEAPIENAVELLESKGFVISDLTFSSEKIDAFSQRVTVEFQNGVKNYYVIVLGSNKKSFYRRQFDVIHELAHFIQHEDIDNIEDENNDVYKKIEREADSLAGYFLLPKKAFSIDVSKDPLNLNHYRELKVKWKVSIASMIYRAKQLEIITQDEFVRLYKNLSKRGWRKVEPLDEIMPIAMPEAFEEALELLFEEKIYTPKSFVDEYSNISGKYLTYQEIEELLCLDEGFFSKYQQNNAKIVSLKKG